MVCMVVPGVLLGGLFWMNCALLSGRYPVPPSCCGTNHPAGTPALAVELEGCKGGFGTQQHPGDARLIKMDH